MLFLPKWTQNVSKSILFHKLTAIFKVNINFQFFTNFHISEMFLPISQNDKTRKPAIRERRNSKTKCRMTMKFGIDVKYT